MKVRTLLITIGASITSLLFGEVPDPGCESYQAWQAQTNVRSDLLGVRNIAFPEGNATYWATLLTQPAGATVTVKGRYPAARYMALQVYDDQRNVVGAINDQDIEPDAGQNNPFRTGTDQGTYTAQIVFGRAPLRPPANTIYTNGLTKVLLLYRIYYSNNPNDLTAGTLNPVLPEITIGGVVQTSCPPRPIVTPEDLTAWGRLDNTDYVGSTPTGSNRYNAPNPPTWTLTVTNRATLFYPSADNSYMSALLSRDYLKAPYNYDMVVMKMRMPTFPNTQAGEVPYLANTERQVRFWSVCEYDVYTTGVNRCIADDQSLNPTGFITIVMSDPSKKPSDLVLQQWNARWMNWGALQNGDTLYDINLNPITNADKPVYYYGFLMYRQTLPNPTWDKSMAAISKNYSRDQWKTAMGDYWPAIGYCSLANFNTFGIDCIGK